MTRARTRRRGFSLLEVMVALAILGSALAILMRMSSTDIRSAHKAKMLTIATGLARAKMYDLEEVLLKEGFKDTQQCETSRDFKDEGHPEFLYDYCIDPVVLPEAQDIAAEKSAKGQANQAAASSAAGSSSSSASAGSTGSPTSMVQMYFPLIKPVLEKSIRKVSLTVRWKIGNQEYKLPVTAFFTALKPIDDAARGMPATPPPPGGGT